MSSLFVPFQFPQRLLSFFPSRETNTFPTASIHLCPILPCSLLCGSLHHSLLLSLLPHFSAFGILHALLFILTKPGSLSPFLLIWHLLFDVHISAAFKFFSPSALFEGLLSSTGERQTERASLFQSQISLQQWEIVIKVDKSRAFSYGFQM